MSSDGLSIHVILAEVIVRDIIQLRDGRLALVDMGNLYVCTSSGHVIIKRHISNGQSLHQLPDGRLLVHMGDSNSCPSIYYIVVDVLIPFLYRERIDGLSNVSLYWK